MNNSKHLIALDLDGTLLNDEKEITPKTAQYVKDLHDAGHMIVIATGRPLRAALLYQQQLGIAGPMITSNGALTTFPGNPTFPKRAISFDRNILNLIIKEIGLKNLDNFMFETENQVYLLREEVRFNAIFWNDRGSITYGNPFLHLEEDPLSVIVVLKNDSAGLKRKITKILSKYPGYHIDFWNFNNYAELYRDNTNKKDGLLHVLAHYNIPLDNLIAAGDAENDREMLELAPKSIWMRNGNPTVEDVAKVTTIDDNNNDGLIDALKVFLN